MSGSNRTDQLLQHVMVPQVSTAISNGRTQWKTLVNLCNINSIQAANLEVDRATIQTTEVGLENGNLIMGLGANPPDFSNDIAGGTTAIGVNTLVSASNVEDNLFVGYLVATQAFNVSRTVALGPNTGSQLSNMTGCVYVGANAGETLSAPQPRQDQNVVVGYNAGRFQGSCNVQLGAFAGQNVSGSGNVMIGFRAGLSNTPVVNFMNTFLVANGSNIPGDVLLYGKFRSTSAPINTNAQLGIGKAPTGLQALDISGDVYLNGLLTVSGSSFGGNSNTTSVEIRRGGLDICNGFLNVMGQGTSNTVVAEVQRGGVNVCSGFVTVSGQIAVNYPPSTFPVSHQLDVLGNSRLVGTLDVCAAFKAGGPAIFYNTVDVNEATRLSNTLTVTSNAAFQSTQSVSGNALFGSNVTIWGTLNVSAGTNFASSLSVTGNTTFSNNLAVQGTASVSGNTLLNSNVAIQGTQSVSGVASFDSNVRIAGSLSVSQGSTVSGNSQVQNSGGFRTVWLDPNCFGNTGGSIALSPSPTSNADSNKGLCLQGNQGSSGGGGVQLFNGSTLALDINNTGRISNGATTSNSLGGVVLSNAYIVTGGTSIVTDLATVFSNNLGQGYVFKNNTGAAALTVFSNGNIANLAGGVYSGNGSGLTNLNVASCNVAQATNAGFATTAGTASNVGGGVAQGTDTLAYVSDNGSFGVTVGNVSSLVTYGSGFITIVYTYNANTYAWTGMFVKTGDVAWIGTRGNGPVSVGTPSGGGNVTLVDGSLSHVITVTAVRFFASQF